MRQEGVVQQVGAQVEQTEQVLRKLPQSGNKNMKYLVIAIVVVLFGVGTGWYLSGAKASLLGGSNSPVPTGVKVNDNEAGISDVTNFKDATGLLEKGGMNNEGTHHMTRDGGPSQTVVLTSTVIDLESYVGKKVQIWGDTLASKKAAWFMDVVKLKVVN